ncbi:MAG: hypothetical protein M1370_10965 [Bacteroidetes bacterium]|nr:hypothetical protein [Bacteroidota bacterium]
MLDRLEALVNEGVRFPMTSKVMIEEEEFLEIVDSLREALTEAQHQPRGHMVEPMGMPRPAYPSQQSSVSVSPAMPDALADNEIIQIAQQRAEALLAEAQERAQEIVSGADSYAMETLGRLEGELNRLVATVRRGKATLEGAGNTPPRVEEPPPAAPKVRNPMSPQYLTGRDEPRRRNTH